jgi:outer membrane protein, multidrug efflux system
LKSIETSGELFKTGRASYLEVLILQQRVLQSKLEMIDTKKSQFFATVNLYKSLGGVGNKTVIIGIPVL